MYAIAGEKVKGEQILGEILPKIRQQLVKNSGDGSLYSNWGRKLVGRK